AHNRLIGQLQTLSLILGSSLTLGLETWGPAVLSLMGADPTNATEALGFLRVRALSAPAVLLMSVGNGAFRVRKRER
ncbi:unnamed protein product, partial [Discosporangium mesarthrocarpum]